MKKLGPNSLLIITALFICLMLGLYVGRFFSKSYVSLSAYDQALDSTLCTQTIRNGRININTATVDDLTLLPGIGKDLGLRIIEYRETNGPFMHIQELTKVKGIGESRLNEISDYISVGG